MFDGYPIGLHVGGPTIIANTLLARQLLFRRIIDPTELYHSDTLIGSTSYSSDTSLNRKLSGPTVHYSVTNL